MGWVSFFENFIQIACLLFAWALVLLAFFILAIQLFITPDRVQADDARRLRADPVRPVRQIRLHGRTVLGNVISSGIKVLVLAVIIGIGSTLFSEFTRFRRGATPSIDDAMAIVLAALSLLGLGIFGPGIANGSSPAARSLAQARRSEPVSPQVACRWRRSRRCRGRSGAAALAGGAAPRVAGRRSWVGVHRLQPRRSRPVRRIGRRLRSRQCRRAGGRPAAARRQRAGAPPTA